MGISLRMENSRYPAAPPTTPKSENAEKINVFIPVFRDR
jgi:hypothetical protein